MADDAKSLEAARYGWSSSFPVFREASAAVVRGSLERFLRDSSVQQIAAWTESIPPLQHEVAEVLERDRHASQYSAILEYELPMEFRRPDVIFLASGAVLVLELKGKASPSRADIDQAAAYARDLRAYHRDCTGRPVLAGLVLTRGTGRLGSDSGVAIMGLDGVDSWVAEVEHATAPGTPAITSSKFLELDAYRPLPTIVEAARELFQTGELRYIKRAAAATEPALAAVGELIREAARTRKRKLILLTGVPGSGKTLVGLQIAHARFLDDLAIPRLGGFTSSPAVYLSGNGPLVQVLQYQLRDSGGGGKTFVRGVKEYVSRYSRRDDIVPPEHVLIFDEAQRAFDAARVAYVHKGGGDGKSEPEHFIEFAGRIPEWCVVVGLIGTGQEIHVGEEAGLSQWRDAVEHSPLASGWTVHGPSEVGEGFADPSQFRPDPRLHLSVEVRYHLSEEIDTFVNSLLTGPTDIPGLARRAYVLEESGYHLRVSRDLEEAKSYLKERYRDDPESRYGMLASARDRELVHFGIPNDHQATIRVRYGPWYGEGDADYQGRSCRALRECVTEFGAQGLELDAALLAWGTDLIRESGAWTNRLARGYATSSGVRDPFQLRVNAYRVLLTRGRDGTIAFVPPIPLLDETYQFLVEAGFRSVKASDGANHR